MAAAKQCYTLGQLITDLQNSENAYRENLRTTERIQAKDGTNTVSTWWRVQTETLVFRPTPDRFPGIDSVEALCDEWGTGLTSENVRKIRGRLCTKLGVSIHDANAMPLEEIACALGVVAPKASTNPTTVSLATTSENELAVYRPDDQPWSVPLPEMKNAASEELLSHANGIDVLLVTATECEVTAVLRRLGPLPGQSRILKGFVGQETYYLGQFGAYQAVVTKCRAGSLDAGGITLAAQHALHNWRPRAVIMPGVAYGKNPSSQKIADVLVASQVISYEPQRVGTEGVIPRGPNTPSNPTLLNRFENALQWSFFRPDGSACARQIGPILSGEKLVDDPMFKAQLLELFPQAIGGEMEGVGLAAVATRDGIAWILVKAICDWADGKKHDQHQQLAAASAVSLVHHVLSQPDSLHGLRKPISAGTPQHDSVVSAAAASVEEIKRRRDIATIRHLFSFFPRPLVDRLLDEAGRDRIHTFHIDCLADAESVFRSTLFHLYDVNLRQILDRCFFHWNAAWSVGTATHHDNLHRGIATLVNLDLQTFPREQYEEYQEHVRQARRAMSDLTVHLHESYPDFDVHQSDEDASATYWKSVEAVERKAEELWGATKADQMPESS